MKPFFAALFFVLFTASAQSQTRAIGAQSFVIDDGAGNYLTLLVGSLGGNHTITIPDPGGEANVILSTSDTGQTITGGLTISGCLLQTPTILSTGPIESGNTLIMNGTSTPRALSSDQDMVITTSPIGNITVIPAPGFEFISAATQDMQNHNIVNVRNPINPQDAATMNYVSTQIATQSNNLATETTNRISGDATNAAAITAETNRAEGAENTLTTNLSNEITNRINGDATVQSTAEGFTTSSITALNLGTASTHASTDFDATGSAAAVQTNLAGYESSLAATGGSNALVDWSNIQNIPKFGAQYDASGAASTAQTNAEAYADDGHLATLSALTAETTRAETVEDSLVRWVSVPDSSTAIGSVGDEARDSNYLYVCVSSNSWIRVAKDTTPW